MLLLFVVHVPTSSEIDCAAVFPRVARERIEVLMRRIAQRNPGDPYVKGMATRAG